MTLISSRLAMALLVRRYWARQGWNMLKLLSCLETLGVVLPWSSLKVMDHQDWTRFGLDQTTQAVYSLKTENDGPDCGQTENHKWTV